MPDIPDIFVEELRSKAPALPDAAFLDRLTACAEGTGLELSSEDAAFGLALAAVKPRPLPAAFHASLLSAVGETPFAVDEKIVLFHKQSKAGLEKVRRFPRLNVAAAAAVALLGALTAFMIPWGGAGKATAGNGKPAVGKTIPNASPNTHPDPNFVPAGYGRNLSETRDEGVIWRGKNQPHRVWRLTFTDMVTLKNEKGETYQVEKPRHEYVIIPEKID
ncbi:hypothetical protein HZ994_18755 [Akkermansiaceae bacterium]|nr:hypothetical protein HZ994_18755 [Akkermansiaceae bacterium]